jgi:hypothetical protein
MRAWRVWRAWWTSVAAASLLAASAPGCGFTSSCAGACSDGGGGGADSSASGAPDGAAGDLAIGPPSNDGGSVAGDMAGCANACDPVRQMCMVGSCVGRAVWGTLMISYDGAHQVDYRDQYYGDATYYPAYKTALIRVQTNGGYTVWSIYVGNAAHTGSQPLETSSATPGGGLFVYVSEAGMSLPAMFRGGWDTVSGMSSLTTVDMRAGGRIAGSLSGMLKGGNGAMPLTVPFSADFDATFPP